MADLRTCPHAGLELRSALRVRAPVWPEGGRVPCRLADEIEGQPTARAGWSSEAPIELRAVLTSCRRLPDAFDQRRRDVPAQLRGLHADPDAPQDLALAVEHRAAMPVIPGENSAVVLANPSSRICFSACSNASRSVPSLASAIAL